MNWNIITGNWNQFCGKLKEEYGDLSNNELLETKGKKEQVIAKFQKRYDLSYAEALVKVNDRLQRVREAY